MTKVTKRVQEALNEALNIAKMYRNSTVELEHLLRAILKNKTDLARVMDTREIETKLDAVIAGFGRVRETYGDPGVSNEVAVLMNEAGKRAPEFISVPLVMQMLLENRRIKGYFGDKAEEATKCLADVLKKNAMNGMNSDDPVDKMTQFAVEMVELARRNKYDPVIGRDDEIRQVIEVLAKKTKSNAIMVGKPGVGKTAIVTGIAQMIARGECKVLDGYKIYNVDVGGMVAGSSLRGEFEERLKGLVKQAEEDEKTILFIDEIHIVLGAGKCDGSLDAANILKPGLADGSLRVIGATTFDEYRQHVMKDPAFERRFTRVTVREPSADDTLTIMRGLRERMEIHHGVEIADRALVYASRMAKRYIPGRRQPDLAIDVIDTACAAAIIDLNSEPKDIAEIRSQLWRLELERTSMEVDVQRMGAGAPEELRTALAAVEEKANRLRGELRAREEAYDREKGHVKKARELKQRLEEARLQRDEAQRANDRQRVFDLERYVIPAYEKELAEYSEKVELIDEPHVMEIVSRMSGVPIQHLCTRENERMLGLEKALGESVYGQEEAVKIVSDALLSAQAGFTDPNRPRASFLFLGPTGVGKTRLSKAICEFMHGSCENMVVLDMSDYADQTSVNKLIGASAGYVGFEKGGTLTEAIKEMPYNVVLLDEVDLAHQSVINVLYQLLDEGRITDNAGNVVSFKDTVVIMTSNQGQDLIEQSTAENRQSQALKDAVIQRVSQRLGKALVNRIDNVVVFNPLDSQATNQILNHELGLLNARLAERKLSFGISDAVREYVIQATQNSEFGGRVVKRFVKDKFVNQLSKLVLKGQNYEGQKVQCFMPYEGVEGEQSNGFTFLLQ